jgi:hypothetical protein
MQQPMRLAVTALFVSTTAVFATPSGLNNIPTADTTPQGTFVFQTFGTVGPDRDDDLNLGVKTGIDFKPVKFELGFDSHLLPDDAGPFTMQGKVSVPLGGNLPSLAAGVANTTFTSSDRDDAGNPFGYLVLSHDFGIMRAHVGTGLQDDDALPFFGVDKTFRTEGSPAAASSSAKGSVVDPAGAPRDLFTLRADAIHQHDSSWVYSAGVLVPVIKYIVFETWGSFPDNGDEASLTLKLNLVLSF